MKKNGVLVSLSFSSLVFLSTFSIAISYSTNQLIHETCRKFSRNDPNINYNFCITSLQASPESRCASNLRRLGSITINLIKRNVTATNHFIKDLLIAQNKTMGPYQKACLIDCLELYGDAVSTVSDAMKAYRSRHYDDANVQLSSVIDAATTCEDGFKERKGVVSPLTKRNNDAFQLSVIALSIIYVLR
ncbi:hypothetical protein FNV43_RR10806 [Rhamnella rubrinervis]|uniref:Pectinesterase inhibitor domain-containing protein n=1 Tax=Rhamnella rubrinervis TaxID=2594499 RepID=A0A8K0H4L6_9ROSA|nr:hypothetical protein FNV43_RR10806 [Rhamnella rubrinervis]